MQVALALPILIALFLLVMERLEARLFGPLADDGTAAADEPVARPVAPPGAQVHRAGNDGNEADIDRQGPGRGIEGLGPWTQR